MTDTFKLDLIVACAVVATVTAASCVHAAERVRPDALKHISLGQYSAAMGDYDRSAEHYERALESSPHSKEILFSLGALYQKATEFEKAEQTYRKLLKLYPLDANGHLCLGNVYLAQERLDLALREYQQAAGLDRQNALAYRNLGYAQLRAGAVESALPPLQRALELGPSNALTRFDLGMAYYYLGRHREAQSEFRTGLDLSRDTDGKATYTDMMEELGGARLAEGIRLYKSNQFAAAAQTLSRLAIEMPDYAPAYAYLGHTYHHQRPPRTVEAVLAYEAALEAGKYYVTKADDLVFVLDNLGMIRMNAGDYTGAEELFRRGVQLDTRYPVVYFNYGMMLARKKLYDASAVAFADAVRRDAHFLSYVDAHPALKPFRASNAYSNLLTSIRTEAADDKD
ncbi:tetratricopeptide repeat protein [bacterium]|nr:tetratricopeptide repeat protein [bacterium]